MRNLMSVLFMLLLLCCACSSRGSQKVTEPGISSNLIVGRIWDPEFPPYRNNKSDMFVNNPLEFSSLGKVTYKETGYEESSGVSGTYVISGQEILIQWTHKSVFDNETPLPVPQQSRCVYEPAGGSIFSDSALVCEIRAEGSSISIRPEKVTFYYPRNAVAYGTRRCFQYNPDKPCLEMETIGTPAKIKEAAKLRREPSVDAETYTYAAEGKKENCSALKNLPAIPRGVQVDVIARTTEKFPVKKWNNHWYLIRYKNAECLLQYTQARHQFSWIYGEFISMK